MVLNEMKHISLILSIRNYKVCEKWSEYDKLVGGEKKGCMTAKRNAYFNIKANLTIFRFSMPSSVPIVNYLQLRVSFQGSLRFFYIIFYDTFIQQC